MTLGPNLTNNNLKRSITLGRGILLAAAVDAATGQPDNDGWRNMENISEATLTVESEFFEHFDTGAGLRVRDLRAPIQITGTFNFTLDHSTHENVNFFSGGEDELVLFDNGVDTAVSAGDNVALTTAVRPGRWYDLRNAAGRRMMRVEAASATFAFGGANAGAGTTLTADQVEVDQITGMVRVRANSDGDFVDVNGNTVPAITDTDTLWLVSTSAPGTIVDPYESRGMLQVPTRALRFIQEYSFSATDIAGLTDGQVRRRIWEFWSCTVTPNGEMPMISDEAQTLPFTASIDANTLASPNSPNFTVYSPYSTAEV